MTQNVDIKNVFDRQQAFIKAKKVINQNKITENKYVML